MSKIFMQFATMQHFSTLLCFQTLDSQMNTGDGSSLALSPPYAISCFFIAKHLAKMAKTTCCLAHFNVFFRSFQRVVSLFVNFSHRSLNVQPPTFFENQVQNGGRIRENHMKLMGFGVDLLDNMPLFHKSSSSMPYCWQIQRTAMGGSNWVRGLMPH